MCVRCSDAESESLSTVQVAAGAAELYVRELAKITSLSESGAAQLAADLDYFCNVLAALGVAVPLQLVTWQARPSIWHFYIHLAQLQGGGL